MIEYNPITPEVLEALREISGKRVITGEDINPDYTHDDMPIYGIGMPEATIDVESTEEIAAIMKLCNEHQHPGHRPGRRHRPGRGCHSGPAGPGAVHLPDEPDPGL